MGREQIRTAALEIKNIKDLRRVLNLVKRDALGDKAHPFHLKQITYYSNPRRAEVVRYKDFTIPKKCGGVRNISAPVAGLKSILTSLNTILQAIYEPSKYAMGFVPGRSVVDNAKIHLGQNYIYNIDLQDFFPSIDKSRVWKRLTLPPFNFTSELADVIAGLCAMRMEIEGNGSRCVLPQGAPTSPTLTNIICEKLDRQLGGLAKRFGARYSRYADDITFSSMQYIYAADGEFMAELHHIIATNRFTINEKKTRLQKKGERQEVTGLVLSDKVNVMRRYARELRTLLHIWEKYGHLAACESYMKVRKANPVYRHKGGMPTLDAVLMGKLQYLKMVKGEEDTTYKALYARFCKLTNKAPQGVKYPTPYSSHIVYLHTMSRSEFEEALRTTIKYREDKEPKLYFVIGDVERPITWSHSVPIGQLLENSEDGYKLWGKYQISLCDNGTTQFYMLHKRLVAPPYTNDGRKLTERLQKELAALVDSDIFTQVLGVDEEPMCPKIDPSEGEQLALKNEKWNDALDIMARLEDMDIPEPPEVTL
ncbi:MAG: RNA-directed DNA polymerase [Alistipes sp.]|nr:RNA-directed DNA polymerase [Alistipes sp.]MBR6632048.1 RNA-directed DNA polymerase [Alistipes sp.]